MLLWKHLTNNATKNQFDPIVSIRKWHGSLLDVRNIPDIASDHHLLRANIQNFIFQTQQICYKNIRKKILNLWAHLKSNKQLFRNEN